MSFETLVQICIMKERQASYLEGMALELKSFELMDSKEREDASSLSTWTRMLLPRYPGIDLKWTTMCAGSAIDQIFQKLPLQNMDGTLKWSQHVIYLLRHWSEAAYFG